MMVKHEKTSDTANRLRTAIMRAFPNQAFKVVTEFKQIVVSWVDGPSKAALQPFADYFAPADGNGYVWGDKRFIGAEKIETLRVLSINRRALIVAKLAEMGLTEEGADAAQRDAAEDALIQSGQLEGVTAKMPLFLTLPSASERTKANVYFMPGVEDAMLLVDGFMTGLDPEQKLKLYSMYKLFGQDALTILFERKPDVDAVFREMAKRLFSQ